MRHWSHSEGEFHCPSSSRARRSARSSISSRTASDISTPILPAKSRPPVPPQPCTRGPAWGRVLDSVHLLPHGNDGSVLDGDRAECADAHGARMCLATDSTFAYAGSIASYATEVVNLGRPRGSYWSRSVAAPQGIPPSPSASLIRTNRSARASTSLARSITRCPRCHARHNSLRVPI